MVHMPRRSRTTVQEVPEEDIDYDDTEADLADEPAFEKGEGESLQDAQDRIEAKYRARATSPLKAIRAFCVLCMGAQPREVAHCSATECVLFAFRDGKNPYQRRSK